MCFHRFETLSHMLASIELSCSQKVDISDDAFIDKNAIQIARQLQALKGQYQSAPSHSRLHEADAIVDNRNWSRYVCYDSFIRGATILQV